MPVSESERQNQNAFAVVGVQLFFLNALRISQTGNCTPTID